jgi:hypothetical protein
MGSAFDDAFAALPATGRDNTANAIAPGACFRIVPLGHVRTCTDTETRQLLHVARQLGGLRGLMYDCLFGLLS